MPAADVTIDATIALKPVPEGDIFAGFTATGGAGGFTNEGSANLVDNKFISSDWTKWCTNDGHKSVPTGESESCWWIDFEASEALNPTGYILTTGNDSGSEHGRNPKNWVLKAKLDAGDAWTTIATVTNDVTMKNKSFKDYKFFVDQSGTYQYFRFEVFANQGANVMQLCELRLIGAEPVVAVANTLQLHVNDALMGSVALQNPSNDIIDNGNGTYTVPEGATVTLLATPNEGYEFIGWKASSSICDFNECEFVDLHKDENPLTVDMYMTAAFMAEFAAVAPTNPEIKLNADFSGSWANTEAFTDNGDGTASWSISTLAAGNWYHFGVKVDGTWTSDNAAFDRENPSRVVSGTGEAMWFQADVAGEYTFTWEYATNTLTIGYPEIHTYTAVGQNLAVFGNSWDPSITANDLVLQEDGSYKWEKNVSFTGAITIQYRVCEDHAWGVAYPATSEQPASFEIPSLGDYKITITYNPVGNVISASAEKIAKPTIQLNGNFSGEWADTEAFEVVEQPMDSYAKLTKLLEPGTYEFGVKVNGEWRANGSAYTRDNYSYIIEEGHTGNLTINVDVKGYYSFFWYYDNNRLIIDYSRVCGMYWKDVTAGNFEVTLGQEGEVTLPKVWATSMAFVYNIANGSDQVRLGSTDETVATIAYTLSMDGLGTLTFHQAGECDIYVVHDMTNLYCYDSCAFHLTVLPAPTPQPAEDVNIIPNVDPDHAGVYYSTFYDSANKYALPAGVEAYVATLDGAKLLLSKIADAGQTIPANNAVILKSTVTPFTLSISDAEAVPVNAINHLQGTDVSIATPGNCYVLAGNDGVGFYHYTASMLNPHKAYVIYNGSNQAPKRMPFIFDQATGVENVQGDKVQSTKVIENGVLYIIKNGVKYNAQGQVVK
jgi:hypothetical protein